MGRQVEADGVFKLSSAAVGAALDLLFGESGEPALSVANAKLVYRTVLTVEEAAGARHMVPLKPRKASNPLRRRTIHV